jgi:homeobox protein cut-like
VQAVGYNSVEAEDWEIATRGEDIGKLETLLLDKNRKMEHELTQVKVRSLNAKLYRKYPVFLYLV